MCSRTSTISSTPDCSAIERLRQALQQADAILIGAGAGLSTAAGFTYSGERFERYFADFAAAYGFSDMYSGGFWPYPTPEEFWAYWSRYILINRYMDPPGTVYSDLLALMRGRDHFVLTTNVDHCFQKAGFDKQRLFYTQGDYGLFQCSWPCCAETWDNEAAVRAMAAQQQGRRIPTALLPVCPHCGRPLTMNLRSDDKFVEDAGWHAAAARYADWLRAHETGRVLYLELGVGYNTPGIIKYPFWQRVLQNPQAVYACVNLGDAGAPREIRDRSICLDADIAGVLRQLL